MKYFFGICVPVILAGIALDRLLKMYAVENLKDGAPVWIVKDVIRLYYTENTGAAFSMLAGGRWFLVALTVPVLAAAFYFLLRGHVHGKFGLISVSMIISGAIGNFIDRLLFGYVVDMFDPTFVKFAVFNVADILLNVGCALFALYFIFIHEKLRHRLEGEPQRAAAETDPTENE